MTDDERQAWRDILASVPEWVDLEGLHLFWLIQTAELLAEYRTQGAEFDMLDLLKEYLDDVGLNEDLRPIGSQDPGPLVN